VAMWLCAASLNAVSLHGFEPKPPLPQDTRLVLVGGGDEELRKLLLRTLDTAGLPAEDAAGRGELDGNSSLNIVNRTRRGKGAQLEVSKPLREAMFTVNTRPRRKHTTTEVFWTFVAACRDAIDRFEADQVVL
jgi:phage replication-related protein YjqB (UPF0714/DUF867 family)